MLLDLIDTNNYAMYNVKLAQVVGLEAAVYCSQLLTIQSKAQKKEKLIDGYFRIDRKFIANQTALTVEQQLQIDENLSKLDIITKAAEDKNLIQVNIDTISTIIANDDVDLQAELSQIVKSSKERKKLLKQQANEAKQQAINHSLLESLCCPDAELKEAMWNWIVAVQQDTTSKPLNKVAVKTFYDDINKYTKGEDLDLAIKLINIATTHYWKTAQAAISKYEQINKSAKVGRSAQYVDGTKEEKVNVTY